MASKEWVKSANGSGIYEVFHLMSAFQEMNRVSLEVSFTAQQVRGGRELVAKVTAWDITSSEVVPPILASASVICSALNLATVETATIHLLYLLDARLASREVQAEQHA